MNIKRNHVNADDERRFITGELPVQIKPVSLYKTPNGDYVIQKFGKEFPELFVGVKYVLKALRDLQAKSVVIREGGTGLVPTLISLANPKMQTYISLWTANRDLVDRNLEENVFYNVQVFVEKKISKCADVSILVHESYQNQASIVEEVIDLVNSSKQGILFMISHKSKGAENLSQVITDATGIKNEIVARGKGGARVIKFTSDGKKVDFTLLNNSYTYEFAGKVIHIQTGHDGFSKGGVDLGSAALIRYVSSLNLSPLKIWDLGCGSGYIGISAALLYPGANLVLSDVNARAVDSTVINVKAAELNDRVNVVLSDGAEAISGEFDLILTNPPLHIPRQHLVRILTQARRRLSKGGRMFLVIEDSRVSEIREFLEPLIGAPIIAASVEGYSILEVKK